MDLKWRDVIKFAQEGVPAPDKVVEKTDAEWRAMLTDDQYQVTRLKGTERPFSSEACHIFDAGIYECICCDTALFDSENKFDSGTGWPSFNQPVKDNAVAYNADSSHGMTRVEVVCNACGSHLGHVFPDGPDPSGIRYCINAISMKKSEA